MGTTETEKNNTFLIFYSTSIDFYGQFSLPLSLSFSLCVHSFVCFFIILCALFVEFSAIFLAFILHFTCAPCFVVLFDKWFACHNLFNFLPCPRVSCILAFFKNQKNNIYRARTMDPVRIPRHIHIIPQDSYDRELHCFHTDNEQARERESEGERVWGGEEVTSTKTLRRRHDSSRVGSQPQLGVHRISSSRAVEQPTNSNSICPIIRGPLFM